MRFGLRGMKYNESVKVDITNPRDDKKSLAERDLHKYLTHFAAFNFNAYTKTIDDKKSKKSTKGANEWLHPDMVGIYSPRDDWGEDMLHLNGLIGGAAVKIYSFELKIELSFSNLRESFFQTVSNSFWSNEAYLAAKEIDDSQDFTDELRRLSSLFGIGIIKIDTQKPENTKIFFSAAQRPHLDWETANKLCEINSDFSDFINAVIMVLEDKVKRMNKDNIKHHFDAVYEIEDFGVNSK